MADIEEYFPRGGKKSTGVQFRPGANFLGSIEKSDKKRKRQKKTEADDGYLSDELRGDVDTSYRRCAIGLNYGTVKPGLLILGRVQNVRETKVLVSLPGRMFGAVMACHISEPYNKMLEAYVNDKEDKVRELRTMFRAGQYVVVKVLEVDQNRLLLSMMPNHINEGRHHADLKIGCILQAAVSSVEDHGYVMDIGIKGIRAFLPKTNSNPDVELDVGMLTWCTIKSVVPSQESSVVTLSSQLDAAQKAVLRTKPASGLLPGTRVEFHVDKCLENGIEGRVFDQTAFIPRYQVDLVNGKKPAIGKTIRARILYTMSTSNAPFLTLKKVFDTTYPDLKEEQTLEEGEIIEEAQVIKITGRSIHFRLGGGSMGTMSIRRLQVDEDLADEEVVAKSYPLGSKHKVRVLCYNLSDYVYSVTDEPSVVNEQYFSIRDLNVGDIVRGEVAHVAEASVTIKIGRFSGLVPHAHLFDSGVYVDPKKATSNKLTKKFKVGHKITARVLSVDHKKQQLFLTVKPSLLAPDLEVLSSGDQAEVGKAYTGVIKHVKDYILVSFFNKVTAYVSKQHVTTAPVDNLVEAFHVGQIVTCTILKKDPETKKLLGSLITEPFWPAPKPKHTIKRKLNAEDETIPVKKHKFENNQDENYKKNKSKKKTEAEIRNEKEPKKKKDKKGSLPEDNEINDVKSQSEAATVKSKKKRNKKDAVSEENKIDNNKERNKKKSKKNDPDEGTAETNTKDSKKKKEKLKEVSEESDAIETDIGDTDQMLTAQDLFLTDLSVCITAKEYKKRIVSLFKAVKSRSQRIEKVTQKIDDIESKGLNTYNQMYHRAMHSEKIILEERVNKLLEALKEAQDKLKELGEEKDDSYKERQSKKKKNNKEDGEENVDKTNKRKKNKKEESQEINVEVESKDEDKLSNKELEKKLKEKSKKIKVVDSLEPALEVPSAKDFWTTSIETLSKKVVEESSSSDDEENEQPKKKRKKLTVAEKLAKVREEEEKVREMERRAIESESQPRSSDQFERALLANPNCSQLWIAYMAFHLQATEIEKARAVGRKALSTIGFREEQERLNVWVALLNCEHRFGTKETQQKTLEEALQMNEPFEVHSKLLDILCDTGKTAELASLSELMTRKYRRDPRAYVACGEACYRAGVLESARRAMQRALAVLEKKEHVSILVQFALMESRHGDRERAEALFEQVLAVYPQRVDVCGVYADMLAKAGDVEQVRQVMERMTSQKLPARKMKVLYRKWCELEERLGDETHVEEVRKRAAHFIENAQF